MKLTPEQIAMVVRRGVDWDRIAEAAEEQAGIELSDESYRELCFSIGEAVAEVLAGLELPES